jgi:2-isopropylmalate synthase
MSGESNVVYWLKKRGIAPEPSLVKAIFAHAKSTNHLLSEAEIHQVIEEHRQAAQTVAIVSSPSQTDTPR